MKQALRCLPTGVTIIGFRDEQDEPAGMTANAVCSVSLEPPLVLVCLNRSSRTWPTIRARGRFGMSVLNEGQRTIAEFCARPGADKRLDPRWIDRRLGPEGPPAIAGALSHLDCAIETTLDAGTHTIVIGRVERVLLGGGGEPLAYSEGAYRQLDPSPERRVEALWDLVTRGGY
jgi:flavin reductase (DIM6/NTAB) family NADH-FMN oxidoreductase RutF